MMTEWWVNYPFKSQKSHFRSHSIIKAMLVGNLTQKYTAAMSILAKPVNWRDRDRKSIFYVMNICHIHDILIYYCHLEQMTIILSSFTHPRVIRTQDILRIIMFFCPFNESQWGPKWSHKLSFVKDRRCFDGTEQHCTPLTFILWTKKPWNVSQDIICLCSNDIRVSKLMSESPFLSKLSL